MTRQEKHRLKRKLEYFKGYYDALLWVQNEQPYDDDVEEKCDYVFDKINDIQKSLKNENDDI
jgi:hypothetical protein